MKFFSWPAFWPANFSIISPRFHGCDGMTLTARFVIFFFYKKIREKNMGFEAMFDQEFGKRITKKKKRIWWEKKNKNIKDRWFNSIELLDRIWIKDRSNPWSNTTWMFRVFVEDWLQTNRVEPSFVMFRLVY